MSEFETVCRIGDIPQGQGGSFPLNGRMVAVFNTGDTYQAIDDTCPHMGASLAAGHLEDGIVTCPWHAWRFSVCDGSWCDNPTLKVDRFEVRISGDQVQVRVQDRSE